MSRHTNLLEELKKRLRDMDEYHLEERAERLREVGGPGVGGLEPRYYPHFITQAGTEKEMKLLALEDSISKLWNEATMCYVDGQFRACIVLCAALLEAALKFEFERRGINYPERYTLGQCIKKSRKEPYILPGNKNDPITEAAIKVNDYRNDVIHANIERSRPEGLLDGSGPEHEVKPVRDASRYIKNGAIAGNGETIAFGQRGLSIIYFYKTTARDTLGGTEQILKFLYPKNEFEIPRITK